MHMELGIDSFITNSPDARTGSVLPDVERMQHLLAEISLADEVGLDAFGLGEHHRSEFLDSTPATILAAAAAQTSKIRLSSAVTVLSAADPVRVFQQFATLDLISNGRAEIVAGRGSFVESFPLFGLQLQDYDALFAEKLDLLLKLRAQNPITWQGKFRPALNNAGVYPRPVQQQMPIWLGVGGTPASFVRAGVAGLPLMVAIIGGETYRFRPMIDSYRRAYQRAGHDPAGMKVGVHLLGHVAETDDEAADQFFPGYAAEFTKIGKERGWPPVTRSHFEQLRSRKGALMVGSPQTVAAKLLEASTDLGGLGRVQMQMSVAGLNHEEMLSSIRLLGQQVAPVLRAGDRE